jgi:pimeloyl-ACP methyl ester carboxylesterase
LGAELLSRVGCRVLIAGTVLRHVDGIAICEQLDGVSGQRTGSGSAGWQNQLMSVKQAWPSQGPPHRDELVEWSSVDLTGTPADALGVIPALGAPAPDGWIELVDGRGVFIRRRPGPAADLPVWYVHGLGGASTDWNRLSAALVPFATGYSLDLPGSGRSDPPPKGKYSPVADADVVAAAIKQVTGGPVQLVGNSYGGLVATLVAARHPDLIATLTVISPAVPDLRLTLDRGADPRLGLLLLPGTTGLAHSRLSSIEPMARARGMGDLCFGHPELITDDDYLVAAGEHDFRAALPWTYLATLGTLRGLMSAYLRPGPASFAAAAARVTAPTLVIWGTRDRLVDVRLSRRAAAAYQRAGLLVLAECGHVAQMEDPESTARGILTLWRHSMGLVPPPNVKSRITRLGTARRSTSKIEMGAPRHRLPAPMATS